MGSRYIELFLISQEEYDLFDSTQDKKVTVKLERFVTEHNAKRCLKLRGLPYKCETEQITEFFAEFKISNSDVVMEVDNGRRTGYALVFLESELKCSQAKAKLDKKMIGGRYIDLLAVSLKV